MAIAKVGRLIIFALMIVGGIWVTGAMINGLFSGSIIWISPTGAQYLISGILLLGGGIVGVIDVMKNIPNAFSNESMNLIILGASPVIALGVGLLMLLVIILLA